MEELEYMVYKIKIVDEFEKDHIIKLEIEKKEKVDEIEREYIVPIIMRIRPLINKDIGEINRYYPQQTYFLQRYDGEFPIWEVEEGKDNKEVIREKLKINFGIEEMRENRYLFYRDEGRVRLLFYIVYLKYNMRGGIGDSLRVVPKENPYCWRLYMPIVEIGGLDMGSVTLRYIYNNVIRGYISDEPMVRVEGEEIRVPVYEIYKRMSKIWK